MRIKTHIATLDTSLRTGEKVPYCGSGVASTHFTKGDETPTCLDCALLASLEIPDIMVTS